MWNSREQIFFPYYKWDESGGTFVHINADSALTHVCPTLQLPPNSFLLLFQSVYVLHAMDKVQDTLARGWGEGMEMVDISLDCQ